MTKRSGGFGLQTARVVKYALGEVELNLANSPKERQKQFNLDVFLQVPRRTGVSTYVVNMLSGHSHKDQPEIQMISGVRRCSGSDGRHIEAGERGAARHALGEVRRGRGGEPRHGRWRGGEAKRGRGQASGRWGENARPGAKRGCGAEGRSTGAGAKRGGRSEAWGQAGARGANESASVGAGPKRGAGAGPKRGAGEPRGTGKTRRGAKAAMKRGAGEAWVLRRSAGCGAKRATGAGRAGEARALGRSTAQGRRAAQGAGCRREAQGAGAAQARAQGRSERGAKVQARVKQGAGTGASEARGAGELRGAGEARMRAKCGARAKRGQNEALAGAKPERGGAGAKQDARAARGRAQGSGVRGAGRGAAGRGQAQQVRADKAGWGGRSKRSGGAKGCSDARRHSWYEARHRAQWAAKRRWAEEQAGAGKQKKPAVKKPGLSNRRQAAAKRGCKDPGGRKWTAPGPTESEGRGGQCGVEMTPRETY
ncbi:hypothetical protein B0H14DRAFT_3151184 [Mycena olivaceomarginata]|nr:hypothetical protein B0H14DRAFT_3151184 [Mycena olivaceomarginata]